MPSEASVWTERNGKTWRVRDLVNGEKVTMASGFKTKTAADNQRTLLEADALRGEALRRDAGEMTLGAWIDLWWPAHSRSLKASSVESSGGVTNRYIRRLLGHLRLRELEENPLSVQLWVNDLLDGRTGARKPRPLAAKTVRNAHGMLSLIFSAAITSKYMRHNPCDATNLPEEDTQEMMFLTYEQADTLLDCTPAYWRPLVALLMATGLRWSEAMGLRVRDIDLTLNRLYVRLNSVEVGGRPVDQTPKTKRGKRFVTFGAVVGEVLAPLLRGRRNDDRVFTDEQGRPIIHKLFYKVWHQIRDDADLRGLRVHDLRHTHVAWLIASKIQLSAISRRIGHKTVAVTDGIYGHLLPEVDEGVVVAVEVFMAKIDLRGKIGELSHRQAPSTVSK